MKYFLLIVTTTLLGGVIESLQSKETKSESSAVNTLGLASHELPHGKPEEVGMSSDTLKEIDKLVQQYVDSGRIEGAVIGITRKGKVIYFEAHGILEGKTPKPMPKDSIFIMASSTKPVIGVATMILIDDGLIKPDDPVFKYIPEHSTPMGVSLNG